MGLEDIVRAAKDQVEDAAKVVADKVGDLTDGVADRAHDVVDVAEDKVAAARPNVEAGVFNAKSKAKVEGEVFADQTRGAAAVAAEKAQDVAEAGEGWFDRAKAKVSDAVSDSALDSVAEKIKGVTPDGIDRVVDRAADAAKRLND